MAQAGGGSTKKCEQARAWIVERYAGAVRRYLSKAVGLEAAADLVQDFAQRVMEGRYHNAGKSPGRFRDYLKTCMFALVADYRAKQARAKMQPLPEKWEPADHRVASDEEDWRRSWRQDLIDRTLDLLQREDRRQDRFRFAVLRLRMDQPELSSQKAAALLSERIGKPVSDGWVRRRLMEARERFGELLLESVAESVNPPTPENIADELAKLDLLDYTSSFVKRLRRR
ncbi:MAG: hypothetical protein L0Y71_25945 [Gemmataceae bacterium]|nr:hypothetical protein [Gemmataceae bacterium]